MVRHSKSNFIRTLQKAGVFVPEGKRLAFLQSLEAQHELVASATAYRVARQTYLHNLATRAEDGFVALIVWQRDCDMCEGTSRTIVRATPDDVDAALDRVYRNAEGPVHWHLQRVSEQFEPTFRDRGLEAFEDGHAHIIYA